MRERPCKTTQHCAVHNFCHRCAQNLTDASNLVVQAIPAAGVPDRMAGAVYAQIMKVLLEASLTDAELYDQRLTSRMSGEAVTSLRAALQEKRPARRRIGPHNEKADSMLRKMVDDLLTRGIRKFCADCHQLYSGGDHNCPGCEGCEVHTP